MHETLNLFGDTAEATNTKPKSTTANRPREKVVLDRRKLWGEGGLLETIEDDETSIHTTESFTENKTLEQLEVALGMSPVIRNGEWARDGSFYMYRIKEPTLGASQFGKKGSMVHFCFNMLVMDGARRAIESLYDDTNSWLPKWSIWLLGHRLSLATEDEDPKALLRAFIGVMSQQDFLDASRKGDSLRRVTKRLHMQAVRKAKAEAKAKALGEPDFDLSELKSA